MVDPEAMEKQDRHSFAGFVDCDGPSIDEPHGPFSHAEISP